MTEPIDKWREEFERKLDEDNRKNRWIFLDEINFTRDGLGNYHDERLEQPWAWFLEGKISQPVVELPGENPMIFGLSGFEKHELIEALTDAGINYRIKGE